MAHLHIAEIDSMPDGPAHAHSATPQRVSVPTADSGHADTNHLRVQIKCTGRTPSTTGLLEPSGSESDLVDEVDIKVEAHDDERHGNTTDEVLVATTAGAAEIGAVKSRDRTHEVESAQEIVNGCVNREVVTCNGPDSKGVNGRSNRSSNSGDCLGTLALPHSL